jgi:hypothetical protein
MAYVVVFRWEKKGGISEGTSKPFSQGMATGFGVMGKPDIERTAVKHGTTKDWLLPVRNWVRRRNGAPKPGK